MEEQWRRLGLHRGETLGEAVRAGAASFPETTLVFHSEVRPATLTLGELLTRAEWEGAELGELARQTLSAFEGPRLSIRGEPARVGPTDALNLALVLYELATNASKYGARPCSTVPTAGGYTTCATEPAVPRASSITWSIRSTRTLCHASALRGTCSAMARLPFGVAGRCCTTSATSDLV